MNKTNVNDVFNSQSVQSVDINYDTMDAYDLAEHFNNNLLSFEQRWKIFLYLYKLDSVLAYEQLNSLSASLESTASKDLEDFSYFILDNIQDIYKKLDIIRSLETIGSNRVYLYHVQICELFANSTKTERPSIIIFINSLRKLIKTDQPVDQYIEWFITRSELDEAYKYNIVQELKSPHMYALFFKNTTIKYQILSGQYLLQNGDAHAENQLLALASDEHTEYNYKADVVDVLLQFASPVGKTKAKTFLAQLSRQDKKIQTIYTNRQNVHDEKIDQSVRQFLLELASVPCPNITLDSVVEKLTKSTEIIGAIERIRIDQALYPGGQLLRNIFVKIYDKITKHKYQDTLFKRLEEELTEMYNTCSGGHVARLVNVFSGIDDFNINIGYEKQIQGNIFGRLNKLIQDISDEELIKVNNNFIKYKETLIDQMNNTELEDRTVWNVFFCKNITNIVDELKKEYAGHISEEDLELFIRNAVSMFETGEK